jgi:hypothetical protein
MGVIMRRTIAFLLLACCGMSSITQGQIAKPDPLLAVDQNRTTVIERIVTEWGVPLEQGGAGLDAAQLREMLGHLRADQLLAASLAGSLSGLHDVLANTLASTTQTPAKGWVAAKALGDPGQDVVYVPVTPCRLVDTRAQYPAVYQNAGPFAAGEVRSYTVQGSSGVCLSQLPSGLNPAAVQLQVFGIPANGVSGDIEVLPQGATFGSSATLVFLGNNPFTSAGTTARINQTNNQISVQVRTGIANVAIDVVGYFQRPTNYGGTHVITGFYATDSGGYANTASGPISTVGGGSTNTASGPISTVGGGINNTASGDVSTVGGGVSNTASVDWSTVGGGSTNSAGGNSATVGGGYSNTAGGFSSTVGGGRYNFAAGDLSTIGGGNFNVTNEESTVGGGTNNSASGIYSTVAGGSYNTASGGHSAVAGGNNNTAGGGGSVVAGGINNTASGGLSAVAGGAQNTASGPHSTVGGGFGNAAFGELSFAAGFHATAQTAHGGTFVWADHSFFDFNSAAANEFAVRATGGVRLVLGIDGGTGVPTWTCSVANGGSWACSSDRNQKQNLRQLDGQAVLAQLATMPIYAWNPKGENAHLRHFGPTAQDFYAAFGLGDSELRIGQQDADGVALAAIQGLNAKLEARLAEKELEIAELRDAHSRELAELRGAVEVLMARTSPEGRVAQAR